MLGRFLTPDWSAGAAAVPYADFADPQTLNLYAYAQNNPLTLTDPNGHCSWFGCLSQLWNELGGYDDGTRHEIGNTGIVVPDSSPGVAQQQNVPTATVNGQTVTSTYPDGSEVDPSGTHPWRDNNPGDLKGGHGRTRGPRRWLCGPSRRGRLRNSGSGGPPPANNEARTRLGRG